MIDSYIVHAYNWNAAGYQDRNWGGVYLIEIIQHDSCFFLMRIPNEIKGSLIQISKQYMNLVQFQTVFIW